METLAMQGSGGERIKDQYGKRNRKCSDGQQRKKIKRKKM